MFSSDIRHNEENYEDWPFSVKPPEGYEKAVALFPSYKKRNVYVNWENAEGKINSFRIGEEDCNGGERVQWWKMPLPEGRYFTYIHNGFQDAFAIDDEQNLWVWGYFLD